MYPVAYRGVAIKVATPFVIEAGDKYVQVAGNSLDEMSLASPALAPGAIFLRTQTKLYRIGGA